MRVDEIQILLDQGRIALNQGRFDEAAELIDRVIAEDANNEQALNLRGLLFFKEEKFTEAVDLFGGLVEKYPEEPTLLMNLGLAFLKSEQFDQAIIELNRALSYSPGNPKIHNYLGLAYSGSGRLQEAKQHFLDGGSAKMADQMLQMMVTSSGEAAETADSEPAPAETPEVDVDVDDSFDETFKVATADAGDDSIVEIEPAEIEVAELEPEPEVAEPAEATVDVDEGAFAAAEVATPAQPEIAPTDLLGSAMHLLKDRYEMVLETAAAGQKLQEMVGMLELVRDENAGVDHVRPNLIRVSVIADGTTLARTSGVLAIEGDVRMEPRQKRYKGKDIKSVFGGDENPVHELVGSGSVFLYPESGTTFFPLNIDGELIYIVEDAFYALSGEWRWENGRLPGSGGTDLHLVQLRGKGTLAVLIDEGTRLGAIKLKSQKLTVPTDTLAGWFGNIVPVLSDLVLPTGKVQDGAVQFQGDGTVLVRVPGS